MSIIITYVIIYVKIKMSQRDVNNLKEFDKNLLTKEFKSFLKELLTGFKSSDTLNKSLECDKKKQKSYNESCRKKMVFEN